MLDFSLARMLLIEESRSSEIRVIIVYLFDFFPYNAHTHRSSKQKLCKVGSKDDMAKEKERRGACCHLLVICGYLRVVWASPAKLSSLSPLTLLFLLIVTSAS